MFHRHKLSRLLAVAAGLALAVPLAGAAVLAQPAVAASVTTAWQNGSFSLNPAGVVAESDIVLGAANTAYEATLNAQTMYFTQGGGDVLVSAQGDIEGSQTADALQVGGWLWREGGEGIDQPPTLLAPSPCFGHVPLRQNSAMSNHFSRTKRS